MHKKKPLIVLIVFLLIISFFIYKTSNIYSFAFHLLFDKGVALKQTNSNINILLLGIGGGSHDGPNLTDTIILASVNQKNNKVVLTSIPRDLWIPELSGADKKINNAYADGEAKRIGGGIPLAKAALSKVTGQQIDYVVRINFSGFVKAVDAVGGLNIDIDNTFDDFAYPISGKEDDTCGFSEDDIKEFLATASAEQDIQDKFSCRYNHLHFDKGLTLMDGDTALEFVRSRHALGVEGTDFARSKRQEKVIKAFKDKILSAGTLTNPVKLINLYDILKGSIDTNIKQSEFDDFIRLAKGMNKANIQSAIIDTGDEEAKRSGFLVNPLITKEYNYEWVLIPRLGSGNFSEIQKYIACKIDNCSVSEEPRN